MFGMEQDLTQFAVNKMLYDDSTGCEEVDNYFATETKIVCEYDQEIPQSQTADNPVAP